MDENGDPKTVTQDEEPEEQPQVPTGEQPETPEEPEQPEEPEIVEDPVEEEQEEKPVSRRESKRIGKLLDKLAEYEQRERPHRPTMPQSSDRNIIPEGDYDLDQVNTMAQRYGQELFQQGLSQAQAYNIAQTFATRLEIDAPKVSSKYKFLDEESPEFNPGPADFINRMYLKTVGYDPNTGLVQNPDIRYHEFVEGFMESVELVSAGKTVETARNVSRQAAQTGVRPGGVAKKVYDGDDPRRMTDEQLDAAIAQGLGLSS